MNVRAAASALLIILIFNYPSHSTATGISPEVSPWPSPEAIISVTDERCSTSSKRTCRDNKSMTACLKFNASSSNSFEDSFLLVWNDGEEPLKANVAIVDIDIKLPEILLSKHQAEKIKILVNINGSPSIILNAGNGKCIIPVGSSGLDNTSYKQYVAYLSPIYGAYILVFTVLIAGVAWACCKFGKNEDQIHYRELEMEQPTGLSANNDEEMGAGWNQGWGDNWEGEEEKSPNEHGTENVSAANGHTSKASDPDGWEKDWEI